MKNASQCPVCASRNLNKKLGFVSPFIAHRVCEFPITEINFGGGTFSPTVFTHAMQCRDCDLIFSQVRYDDEEMARIYKDYRGEEYNRARTLFEPGYADVAAQVGIDPRETEARMDTLLRFLSGLVDGSTIKSILDYGGDQGQNIPPFTGLQKKYVYEVSAAVPLEGVERVTDLKQVPQVDMVMNANVLEHIPYPATIMDAMKPLFHRNSFLFVDVPYDITERNPFPNQFHEHINYFNLRAIKTLLKAHGFDILKAEHVTVDLGRNKANSIYVLARPAWFC
jgi:hypothetical protein